MTETEQPVLSSDETVYLPQAWRLLGGNDLGSLAVRKLGNILRGFGKNPTEQEVHFLKYDNGLDDHHRLTYEEAVQLYQKCKNHVETEDMMVEAFKKFDEQGNGFIMVAELKDIMSRLGEPLNTADLEEMISDADKDHTGKINYREFSRKIMVSPRVMLAQTG